MSTNAVIYARVSTDEQAEQGISLDMQVARCAEYIEARGLDLIDTVVDPGFSAKTLDRPGMRRILDMVHCQKIGHVITWKLDRFSRNTIEALQLVAIMAKRNVELHIVSEQGTVKTDSADDEFLFTLKASLAQRERRVIAERTKAALARKRERHEFCGGETPYGYRNINGTLVPDIEEQGIIQKIRNLRNLGYSLRRITQHLADDGCVNRRGKPFTKTAVERILTREAV